MDAGRSTSPLLRIFLIVLGIAGILLGLFLLAVASFADGSTGERVVTMAIAVGFVVIGVFLLRFSRSR
jgi:formate-dependent nitrite reductase membrane component NrfD